VAEAAEAGEVAEAEEVAEAVVEEELQRSQGGHRGRPLRR